MSRRSAVRIGKGFIVSIVAFSALLAAVPASAGFGYPTSTGFGDFGANYGAVFLYSGATGAKLELVKPKPKIVIKNTATK